ncbi:hypothetical protein PROFUN_02155 [Planoprotostelium fungivorum]|uniref:Uncharacterized protein n=1 Tax=Planoprotostelium fungivorum TaxID=1890364 RepID=A0A2P6NZA1_9EUKA|nr:hypothetical protein PROFUN_02155 [Planoprotostelium fungivorum]
MTTSHACCREHPCMIASTVLPSTLLPCNGRIRWIQTPPFAELVRRSQFIHSSTPNSACYRGSFDRKRIQFYLRVKEQRRQTHSSLIPTTADNE